MRLKSLWDPKDTNLVVNDRFTETGMSAYWNAIDASFKFNETRREVYVARKVCMPEAHEAAATEDSNFTEDPVPKFFKSIAM